MAELLEGARDVERIEVLRRHAVGQQRDLQGSDGALGHRPAAREFRHVPQVGPLGGNVDLEGVGPVGEHGAVDIEAEPVRLARLRHELVHARRRQVERFQHILARQDLDVEGAQRNDVPLVVVGLDLRLNLPRGKEGSRHEHDLDAGLLGEWNAEGGAPTGLVGSARLSHDETFRGECPACHERGRENAARGCGRLQKSTSAGAALIMLMHRAVLPFRLPHAAIQSGFAPQITSSAEIRFSPRNPRISVSLQPRSASASVTRISSAEVPQSFR